MKQRICSIILVITLFLGSIGLEGCGAKSDTSAMHITQGEWITLINDAFGMYGYVEETPYYTNIKPGNPYFEQIQIAREWNVIDGSVSEFDLNAYVTYAFAAVTLINATGFVDEEVTAGKKVSLAQEWGFIVTEEEYEIEDYISYNDAVVSLYFAKNQWADLSFDHVIEEVTFAEDVINYIEEDFVDYEINDGKTYIPAYAYTEMKAGDVYVLPANKDNLVASAFIVEEVYQEGDYYVVVNSVETENILDYVEELNIEETYTPDLLASDVYDANGNLIYSGSEYAYTQRMSLKNEFQAQKLNGYTSNSNYYDAGLKSEIGFAFEYKGATISGAITNNGVKFGLEQKLGEWKFASGDGGNKDNVKESVKLFAEAEIKNIEVTNDVDMSWGKIKKARVAVDYESSIEGGIKVSSSTLAYRAAPYNNGNGSFLTNLKKAVTENMLPGYAKGAESIKVCSFDIASAGVAKVTLGIYVYVEASGKMSVKCTYESTRGIEYSNGNLRYINTDNETREFIINASIESGLQFKLMLDILSVDVISLELKFGIGIEAKLEVHFVDNENHLIESGSLGEVDIEIVRALESGGGTITLKDMQQIAEQQGGVYEGTVVTEEIPLHIDNCLEVSVYVKVSLGLSLDCLLSKVFKASDKAKVEYKTDLLTAHVDNLSDLSFSGLWTGKKTTECTKKFTPFKALEEAASLEAELNPDTEILTYDYEEAGYLGISQYTVELEAGQTEHIKVSNLPKGYELKDVVFESNDESIAMVSEDGTVLGLNTGVTYIRVYIPDTQFEMRCAIIVGQEEVVPFEKLQDM